MAPTNILRADNARPKRGPAPSRSGRSTLEKRDIVIRAGRVVLRARLLETPTAALIWQQLPLYSTAETWGRSVHFKTEVEAGREPDTRAQVQPGDIAFWLEQDRIIIAFGRMPLSKADELVMPSPVNVWATALDDVAALARVQPGERVSVLHADS